MTEQEIISTLASGERFLNDFRIPILVVAGVISVLYASWRQHKKSAELVGGHAFNLFASFATLMITTELNAKIVMISLKNTGETIPPKISCVNNVKDVCVQSYEKGVVEFISNNTVPYSDTLAFSTMGIFVVLFAWFLIAVTNAWKNA